MVFLNHPVLIAVVVGATSLVNNFTFGKAVGTLLTQSSQHVVCQATMFSAQMFGALFHFSPLELRRV
jgi:hypothetical protein